MTDTTNFTARTERGRGSWRLGVWLGALLGVAIWGGWGSRALAADPVPAELLKATVDAAGGEGKLLKLFRMKERLALGSDPEKKGNERVSVLEPPGHWWLGKVDRVVSQKEPATFLVWAWTMGPLVDPKSKLELRPDITHEERPAFGIRVTETVTPAMDLYFDRETKRLVRIDWRTDKHVFSDWKEVDGASYPAKCVGYKLNSGARWYHTEILEVTRLKELPEGLTRGAP